MPSKSALSTIAAGHLLLAFASSVHGLNIPSPTILSCPANRPGAASFGTLSPNTPNNRLSSSKLFGTRRRRNSHNRVYYSSALQSSTTPNGSNNNAVDAEITKTSSSSSSSSSGTTTTTSFFQSIDNFGMKLKPLALSAYEKAQKYDPKQNNATNGTDATLGTNKNVNNRVKSILCRMQANILWMLYILYRGYRGFFVILPAVFREVYRQLEESDLVVDVYGDENSEEGNGQAVKGEQQQPPMRSRTRITISVLSGMLTLSYVVSGALRVLGKFIKTFTNTTSVESSFEAAAEEVAVNEDKLRSTLNTNA
mmetsp:Transcript_27127/g.57254  ORF Transcript_27127/g.57254 Transcript_27127/m.57254 type:complete len:310 (-) Transcript_27127:53-982(-)